MTPEEKARIREEEIFRQEVRKELEQVSPVHQSPLLKFLNSALGVWLLSTIVVGFASWNYSQWTDRRAREAQRSELVRKLDLEISSRVETLTQMLDSFKTVDNYQMALQLSEKPAMGLITLHVLPEFESRGLRSLLWELQSLVAPDKRPEITRALRGAQELARLRLNAVEVVGSVEARTMPVPAELRDHVHKVLTESLGLARWRIP